jgi:hypothetical protein
VPVVEARVGLLPAESGGLGSPMPTGSRSLLVAFAPLVEGGEDVKVGAVIDVIGGLALVPGVAELPVIIRFWADEAGVYLPAGRGEGALAGRAGSRDGIVTRRESGLGGHVAATARRVASARARWDRIR